MGFFETFGQAYSTFKAQVRTPDHPSQNGLYHETKSGDPMSTCTSAVLIAAAPLLEMPYGVVAEQIRRFEVEVAQIYPLVNIKKVRITAKAICEANPHLSELRPTDVEILKVILLVAQALQDGNVKSVHPRLKEEQILWEPDASLRNDSVNAENALIAFLMVCRR